MNSNVAFNDANIVFVSDYFIDEYAGGAELTTDSTKEFDHDLRIQNLSKDTIFNILQ